MSYTVANVTGAAPATGNTGGLIVNCWDGNRFSPVNTPPATNGSPPSGSPDAGPLTTASYDAAGSWVFAVSTPDQWIISFYDPTDTSNGGSYNTYWLGPYLINPSTNQVPLVSSATYSSTQRSIAQTTIASGSNGNVLPQTVINVASTTGFPSSGFIGVFVGSGYTIVAYTGTSGGNQFTGCTGGSGTLVTGRGISPAYQATVYRRLIFVTLNCEVYASGDEAYAAPFFTANGAMVSGGYVGIAIETLTGHLTEYFPAVFSCDPSGYYGMATQLAGTGNILQASWVEVDL